MEEAAKTNPELRDIKWPDDPVHLDKWAERGGEPYTGRDYPAGWIEILTMGIERLSKDPAKFCTEDPEHFEFVVTTFRGW